MNRLKKTLTFGVLGAGVTTVVYASLGSFTELSVSGNDSNIIINQSGAIGINNEVSNTSIAVGSSNKVHTGILANGGGNSATVGAVNEVYGTHSFVAGTLNDLHGSHSAALGLGLVSNSFSSTVVGKFNADNSGSIFTAGNGANFSSRSNALTISEDGETELTNKIWQNSATGTLDPSEIALDVSGHTVLRGRVMIAPQGDIPMGIFSAGVLPQ